MSQKDNQEHKPFDRGYKAGLKQKKEFIHFLQKYVEEEWTKNLKPEHLNLYDKEFILGNFGKKEADIVWEITLPEYKTYVFVDNELQSSVDYTMPLRTFIYMACILLNVFQETTEKERERKEFRLPVVIAIVFYNGEDKWTVPVRFRDYQRGYELFGDYGIDFQYYLIDLKQISEEHIMSTNFLIDNILAVDRVKKQEELIEVLKVIGYRVQELRIQEQRIFHSWLEEILCKAFPDIEDIKELQKQLEERGENHMVYSIERIAEKARQKAKIEGRAEGRAERETELIINLLKENVSTEVIIRSVGTDKQRIEEIKKELYAGL